MSTIYRRIVDLSRSVGADRLVDRTVGAINGTATTEPVFHLTFDDGPHPRVTPEVLEVLSHHDAPATFFVLVGHAEEQAALVQEMIDRGHEIGLHTRSHRRLSTLPWQSLMDEIVTARRELESLTGTKVRWFRPPYGAQGIRALPLVRMAAMTTVNWSVDSSDWKGITTDDPLSEAVGEIAAGGILLLHDTPVDSDGDDRGKGFISKAELTDIYLKTIAGKGLAPVSLSDLTKRGPWVRQARLS